MFARSRRGPCLPLAATAVFLLNAPLPAVYAQEAAPAIAAFPVAPASTEKVDEAMMARIREEGMKRSQLPQTLAYLTDVIGPRLTNSPGMLRANEWTKTKLIEWGLKAKLEPWGPFGRGWSMEKFSAQVISPVNIPLIALPKAWSPGWKGVKTAEVVYVDAASEADLEKFKGKVKGKFCLVSPLREVPAHFTAQGSRWTDEELERLAAATPQAGGRRPRTGGAPDMSSLTPEQRRELQQRMAQLQFGPRRMQFLLEEGAALILDAPRGDGGTIFIQQATVAQLPATPGTPPAAPPGPGGSGTRRLSPWSKEAEKRIPPQVAVSVEHYNRLVRMVQAGEKVTIAVEMENKYHDGDGMASNTIGELPGTDKAEEIVMCGGHMDSWHGGTGATDNGAGVAVCMEALRILKTLGVQPRRTVRIGLWSGEEQGIFGSAAYVRDHFGNAAQPKPEYDKFSAYFNLDNGTGKIRGVYAQGNEAIMPIFAAWLQPFKDLGASIVTVRNTGGTDHLPFDSAGLPGFQFVQDTIEYDSRTHHSNQDVYDRIQVEDMKQAAVIMAAFLYNAAMRDEKLPRKP
jgi:carboxypeptidase Q